MRKMDIVKLRSKLKHTNLGVGSEDLQVIIDWIEELDEKVNDIKEDMSYLKSRFEELDIYNKRVDRERKIKRTLEEIR